MIAITTLTFHNGLLWFLLAALTIYLPLRLVRLIRTARGIREDRRWFYTYGLWFPLLLFLQEGMPPWRCHPDLVLVVEALVLLGMVLDFLYFFGLKSKGGVRHQIMSAAFSVLLSLPWARGLLLPNTGPALQVPVYERAVLWTDTWWKPEVYYLMNSPRSENMRAAALYGDPHEGKAVFSPLTGTVQAVDERGFVTLVDETETLRISVGPIMPETLMIRQGQPVFADQPLGLLDKTQDIPGIRLVIHDGKRIRFGPCIGGRYVAREAEALFPRRNLTFASRSKSRFRFADP
ncbi:hypothetical protein SCOR_11370 [Sulfidibacter corallicola]|uniref:Uncharacterized protein n=1 Tax=Sulfidibacter corallicola TaxID=2818388 RepID=A0A8A4TN99_SULCO|nr:hypothetical protein [Sulfidibacter corallicola]QTD48065.1 hypothetical protein J3U87_20975 [Sulfidibacter corallicola]